MQTSPNQEAPGFYIVRWLWSISQFRPGTVRNTMKKTNTMLWLTDYAPLIVPLFPMAIVSLAAYFFCKDAALHPIAAAAIAIIAAVAIELAGISSFRTLTGVYQSFKHNHQDGFVVIEFAVLVIGVIVYLGAIALSSLVLDRQFPGSWPLGAMAGMMAVAVYVVRAVGETYHKVEKELEQDKAFEHFKAEQLFKQEIKDREHARIVRGKKATVQVYETRTELEQAKHGIVTVQDANPEQPKSKTGTTSNSKAEQIKAPLNSLKKQSERNKTDKAERIERLLNVFSKHPNIGQNAAGRMIDLSAGTTSGYVRELTEAGRLAKNGNGWKVLEWRKPEPEKS